MTALLYDKVGKVGMANTSPLNEQNPLAYKRNQWKKSMEGNVNKQSVEERTTDEFTKAVLLTGLEPASVETTHSPAKYNDGLALMGEVADPRIVMAVQLYQASYEGMGTPTPSLAELIEWMLEANAYTEVDELQDRLGYIHAKLSEYGIVLPDDLVEVPGRDILLLRLFSESP